MEKQKVEMFMMSKGQFFGSEKLPLIQRRLEEMDDSRFGIVSAVDYKNPTTVLIVSLLFGPLGIDRFMLGQTGLGIFKLLTAGGCGVWALIDWFLIMGVTRDTNYSNFMKL